MMKRTAVTRLPEEPAQHHQNAPQIQQAGASNMHTLAQSAQQPILGAAGMVGVGGFGRAGGRAAAPVISYLKPGVQYAPPQPKTHHQHRIKQPTLGPLPSSAAPLGRQSPAPAPAPLPPHSPAPAQQFQRLKVEDALSYLDQVKFKFNNQPQVYNDFLDIMKEFKSQTIDTPGVITRVSNLFKGHPELIVGFNTFLPPGYKIEVQRDGQVSVSMPSPTGMGGQGVLLGVHGHPQQQQQLVHLLPVQQSVPSSAIVHNLSHTMAPAPTNTLHQISQAHQQIEAAAIHHAPGAAATTAAGHATPAPAGQPVEFNHAIEYVNKIKSRFSRQPDKYKRFLEILHAYQRGHRDLKEPHAKQQTEQEVYSQVAKLFENQEDLLTEFGQFLPDAKAVTKPPDADPHYPIQPPPSAQPMAEDSPERFPAAPHPPQHHAPQPAAKHPAAPSAPPQLHLKRSPSFSSSTPLGSGPPPAKKPRSSCISGPTVRDVSYAEAAKLATVHDFSFFERARRALRHHHVYDNFMRCLLLFTNEIVSSSELLSLTAPFLCRHPELQKWLQDFVGPPSPPHTPTNTVYTGYNSTFNAEQLYSRSRSRERERERERERVPVSYASHSSTRYEPVGAPRLERGAEPTPAMDIDLTTCKRLGTSYCALPREAAARRCSGRTPLCKEVLNDTWVSFPTWSEDSTFVTSRKTQYEEYIYRCEDERFELDVVIETNASTIRVLEGVQKKLSRMSAEDAAKYRLDDCLGGHSPTIHQRALKRIYGDKVAVDIIAGLKKNPVVAVPVVLRRLKAKEEEWREAQKGFNKQWREQNEKYYLKSLDHQGINFKQNDLKAMRSKSLFNEVEAAYAARRAGPHLVVDYAVLNRQEAIKIVRDTAELLIHHARRQTGIQKAEKRRIKQLLRHFLPDLFNHPRQPLSDDERDEDDKDDVPSPGSPAAEHSPDNDKTGAGVKSEIKQESSESDNASDKSGKPSKNNKENKPKNNNTESKDVSSGANAVKRSSSNEDQLSIKSDVKSETNDPEDDYRDYPPNEARFVCTSSWYLFLRVHAALCQRLAAARRAAQQLARDKQPCAASALRLKPNNLPAEVSSPAEYYGALLELVRGVLDGNVEPSAYEDAAREMLGIKAYPAYTLDKLVSIAVRQLQHIVSEPWSLRAAELAARGGLRGSTLYVHRARRYLRDNHTAFLVKAYGGEECKLTFELLEGASGEGRTSPTNNDNTTLSPTNQRGSGSNGGVVSRLAEWSLYAERFARPGGGNPAPPPNTGLRSKPVFLVRNARARSGGYTHNAHSLPGAPRPHPAPPRRRKPPRLHDAEECTLTNNLRCRLLAFRPLQLYQPGSLLAARASHARLHAARRNKFRAWLRGQPRD